MILNTGSRTDIPAYYSNWFYNRIREGFVYERNPFSPSQVTSYLLDPCVIDACVFCTKNPAPMMERLSLLSPFDTFWFVTITPYGQDVEPFVPPTDQAIRTFRQLSALVGPGRISWRYDPVFLTDKYSLSFHMEVFHRMAGMLAGYTDQCVVSFIDLYEKTKRNFKGVTGVTPEEQDLLISSFSETASKYGLQIHLCCENASLVRSHVDAGGCLSKAVLEQALDCRLDVPKRKAARSECTCLLGADIGAYNTCSHGCLYCYANYDRETVLRNRKLHNPGSPLLIGEIQEGDVIKAAEQKSWKNGQMELSDLL